MNTKQRGFGGLQAALVGAFMGMTSLIAVPQYDVYVSKTRLTEAISLAEESRRKVSNFYVINGRLPQSGAEAHAMRTMTLTPFENVRDMAVAREEHGHDIVIKVYLKDGVVENPAGQEQYIYFAGRSLGSETHGLQWTCGALGVSADLLPKDCAGQI